MRRRISTFGSALSLLLCTATVVLWVRSYFSYDVLHHGSGVYRSGPELAVRDWYIEAADGSLDVKRYEARAGFGPISNVPAAGWQWIVANRRFVWRPQSQRLGFAFHAERWPATGINYHRILLLRCPSWALVTTTALGAFLPYLCVRHATVRLRRADRLCVHCGYDLRATPHRCPECGTPVPQKTEAMS